MELEGQRILITGASGCTGQNLIPYLRRWPDLELFGIGRSPAIKTSLDGFLAVDLADAAAVTRAVSYIQPDLVFHLAALNSRAPDEQVWRINVEGSGHLLDALRDSASLRREVIRVVVVGSAAEIGSSGAAQSPVAETVLCQPESAYGKSKFEMTRRCQREKSPYLEIVIARLFNLIGPGLGRDLALGNIAAQIREIRSGQRQQIECGSLAARRDFVDVRDAVGAYVTLAQRGNAGEIYNVCTGHSHRLRDLVQQMLGEREVEISERVESRPGDVPDIFGDPAKIRQTGWKPEISISQSLRDMVSGEDAP